MIQRKTIVAALLSTALLPLLAHAEHAAHEWDYDGAKGPAKWASLKKDYSSCGLGHQQSPIDIRATTKGKLEPIAFDYKPSALKEIDNGHTIQINYAAGSGITVDGKRHELLQFHFHTPSEERINGKSYPLVAHLVHKSAEGKLAVVAVLFKFGKENPTLATVWANPPKEKTVETAAAGVDIDLAALLPAEHGYYNFAGSLTTPPCSEQVNWFVLKAPVELSAAQLKQFHTLYKHNARPVQALHGRIVKEST
ncbi:MAG: carbonic anhydrase family protein [Massilia sp.]